jgi:hypothetical protein
VLLSHGLLVWAFWRQYGARPERGLWTATLALTPIVLVSATTAMDYLPGAALALLGYTAACRGRPRAAAVWIGLSIGVRLSNALLALPLMVVLADRTTRRGLVEFVLLTSVVGGLPYLPILWMAGLHMLALPDSSDTLLLRLQRTAYNGLKLFGVLASVGIAAVILMRARAIAAVLRDALRRRDAEVLAELAAVGLMLLLFAVHPDEAEYMLAIVPFGYLLVSRWLTRPFALAFCLFVLSDAVFRVELKGGESGHRALVFTPGWGTVVDAIRGRREWEALRQGVAHFDKAEHAVIMTGLPQSISYDNDGLEPASDAEMTALLGQPRRNVTKQRGRDVYVLEKLSREDCERLRAAGYQLYIFSVFAPPIALQLYEYDPTQYFERLEILSERAFYR